MSSTVKHNFSTPQRFGVWLAHGSRCFWCAKPIEFRESTVDHVLAESLLQDPERLAVLRQLYALGEDFQINDYENWVPSHGVCNSHKGVNLEPVPSPAMIDIFRRVRAKASDARRIAAPYEKAQPRSKVFARILGAIENGTVTADDIRELLAGYPIAGPVTIADWEATPIEDSSTGVDVHKAPKFPGWTRISFDEQASIEAALLGQSMCPRHVKACPQVPEVRDVVTNLERLGAVAVTGDSGCGKSMVAWHAAHDLHDAGWAVYLLTNPVAAIGELPSAFPRALLVIDDAQSLSALPARAAAADNHRAVMAVSTSSVPGFRVEVRLSGKRCVEMIAASLGQRENELLPILSRLNPHFGPRAMDDRIGIHIADAMKRSEYPWQFMFNLGGGHLRLKTKLAAVAASEPLDRLLYLIAAYQLATRDTPCPLDWLLGRSVIGIQNKEDLLAYLRRLESHLELVRTVRGIATPHPRVAGIIIRTLFYGTEGGAKQRRELLWEVLRDPAFPLRGVHWLIGELPDDLRAWFGLSGDLNRMLVSRCYASADIAGAGLVLSQLMSIRDLESSASIESIAEREKTIIRWMETCDAEQAIGVEALMNSIINHDRGRAQALIDATDPLVVADRIQRTIPADAYAQGGLLGRLTFGSPSWRRQVVSALDQDRLTCVFGACQARDLGGASEFVKAISVFDESLGLELGAAIVPAIVAAMREDPRAAMISAREVIWFVFHYGPALVGMPEPDERRASIVRGIFKEVGVVDIARAYQAASRRDWDGLDSLSVLLRQTAPDMATELSGLIDIELLLPVFKQMDAYEIDRVLIALALNEEWEPAATVARTVCAPTGRLSWRAAAIAPDAAVEVVTAGGSVKLTLSGGLPGWDESTLALGAVYEKSPDAAKTILRAHVAELADGLLYRQSNGGDGAHTFLRVASAVDDDAVVAAARAIDLATARVTWAARARGQEEERTVLAEFISIATRAGGEVAQLAKEVRKSLENEESSTSA